MGGDPESRTPFPAVSAPAFLYIIRPNRRKNLVGSLNSLTYKKTKKTSENRLPGSDSALKKLVKVLVRFLY